MILIFKWTICLSLLNLPFLNKPIYAHKGKSHKTNSEIQKVQKTNEDLQASYTKINELYLKNVKPIFKNKCFDCHSDKTAYPWYYKIPGIKQMIDNDIQEAKEHLDFSEDFPFAGHGEPLEDLEEIKKVLEEESMPPWNYRLMHRNSKVTVDERKSIIEWINTAQKM